MFGMQIPCSACGRPFYILQTDHFYKTHFSEEIFLYILQRKRNQQAEHLEQEVNDISQWVQYLASIGLTLRTATRASVESFIQEHLPPQAADTFKQTLMDLFETIRLHGLIATNPLATSNTTSPTAKTGSEESATMACYRQHRHNAGQLTHLEQDLVWIQTLEKQLATRRRTIQSAKPRDISLFLTHYAPEMADMDRIVLMLTDYCTILQQHGMISENLFAQLGQLLLHGTPDTKRSLLAMGSAPGHPEAIKPTNRTAASAPDPVQPAQPDPAQPAQATPAEPAQPKPEKRRVRTEPVVPPRDPSDYPFQPPPPKKGIRTTLWVICLALLAIALSYTLLDTMPIGEAPVTPSTATIPERTKPNTRSPAQAEDKNNTPKPIEYDKDRATAFFYQKNMKAYYCRDYLKTGCSTAQLIANPLPVNQDTMIEGGRLYFEYCARCHGETGKGNGPDALQLAAPLERLGWSGSTMLEKDAYLFWIIAEGGNGFSGQMPQFKHILSEQEIWKIILFLSTLR